MYTTVWYKIFCVLLCMLPRPKCPRIRVRWYAIPNNRLCKHQIWSCYMQLRFCRCLKIHKIMTVHLHLPLYLTFHFEFLSITPMYVHYLKTIYILEHEYKYRCRKTDRQIDKIVRCVYIYIHTYTYTYKDMYAFMHTVSVHLYVICNLNTNCV